jgi:hypothetical protein
MGARLPLIRNEKQDKWLVSFFGNFSYSLSQEGRWWRKGYWLGNVKSREDECEVQGQDVFTNWREGAPTRVEEQDAIEVRTWRGKGGQWNDTRPGKRRFVICECEAPLSLELASSGHEENIVDSLFNLSINGAYSSSHFTLYQLVAATLLF